MTSHLKLMSFTFLTLCCVFAGFCFCIRNTVGASNGQKEPEAKVLDPIAEIDAKAALAIGNDEIAIQELSSAVLDWAVEGRLPPFLTQVYKERLARAEINYRTGAVPGIVEHNIVLLLDGVVAKLEAPEYARTDDDEVRYLRAGIALQAPHLVGKFSQIKSKDAIQGGPVVELSPIEAIVVTRILITQKEHNRAYQTTPAERREVQKSMMEYSGADLTQEERNILRHVLLLQKGEEKVPAESAEEVAARIVRSRAEQEDVKTRGVFLIDYPASPRATELGKVFQRAYRMNISDALALTDSSLELLGIGK